MKLFEVAEIFIKKEKDHRFVTNMDKKLKDLELALKSETDEDKIEDLVDHHARYMFMGTRIYYGSYSIFSHYLVSRAKAGEGVSGARKEFVFEVYGIEPYGPDYIADLITIKNSEPRCIELIDGVLHKYRRYHDRDESIDELAEVFEEYNIQEPYIRAKQFLHYYIIKNFSGEH